MIGKKKIAVLSTVLIATLVVGVYAGMRLSNILTAYWSVSETQENLELSFVTGYGIADPIPRGVWQDVQIRLQNVGAATYNVRVYFKIWTAGPVLPTDSIKILYWEVTTETWLPLPMTGWESSELTGWFGPEGGFPVPPGYDVVSYFQVLFDGTAPLTGYGFQAYAQEIP